MTIYWIDHTLIAGPVRRVNFVSQARRDEAFDRLASASEHLVCNYSADQLSIWVRHIVAIQKGET
jgi:hypothetical protein